MLLKANNQNYPSVLTEKEFRRFWDKVERTDYCWNWTAGKLAKGYGTFKIRRKSVLAHRLSYIISKGSISEEIVLDHSCRNHSCVNPDHLEPVTNKVNVLRGEGASAQNALKQKCSRNHPLVFPNLVKSHFARGQRDCLSCHRANNKYYKAKSRHGIILDPNLLQQVADEYYREIMSGI